MSEARGRFATAFYGSYSIDRIVGAANMFDLLPDSRAPKTKEIELEAKTAIEKSRAIFKALPDTYARQSALSALASVGRASLRDKVLYCAKTVQLASGNRFHDIELPCTQAVLCRNHFVHGSRAEFNYVQQFGSFAFLVNTLEFVFAFSDLIELGWNFEEWRKDGAGLNNEFGAYLFAYDRSLTELKGLLAAKED